MGFVNISHYTHKPSLPAALLLLSFHINVQRAVRGLLFQSPLTLAPILFAISKLKIYAT